MLSLTKNPTLMLIKNVLAIELPWSGIVGSCFLICLIWNNRLVLNIVSKCGCNTLPFEKQLLFLVE